MILLQWLLVLVQRQPRNLIKALQENAYGVTAAYAIPSTPIKLKAQYISAKTEVDGIIEKDRKQDLYGVGADYQINKQAFLRCCWSAKT
jgi:predicted porin